MVNRGVNTFTFCPQVIADAIISQVGSAQGDEFGVTKLLELSLFSVPIWAWSTARAEISSKFETSLLEVS